MNPETVLSNVKRKCEIICWQTQLFTSINAMIMENLSSFFTINYLYFRQKMYSPNKLFLTGAIAVLGLTVFGVNPAYSTSFSLNFLNSSGQQVGSGGFTYTDNEITCVETSIAGRCGSSGPPIDRIFVTNYLSSFTATILGVNISRATSSWWVDPSRNQSAGTRSFSRYGIMIQNYRNRSEEV